MAPSAIDIATSTFVALFVEAVLYGIFILLFALSMSVLLAKKKRNASGNIPLIVVSVVMFGLATLHIATDMRRAMESLLFGKNISAVNTTGPSGYILKTSVYATQTLVGDLFMIYRVYLVWNGDKRVCIPLLVFFLGGVTCAAGTIHSFTTVTSGADPIFLEKLHNWIVSFFSLTLFTNFTSTMLIAGRIWWVSRSIDTGHGRIAGSKLGPAIMIIVESGAIYSVCLILLLALYVNGSYAQYVLLDAEVQVVGVVFSMIIVRVGMGLSSDMTTYTNNNRTRSMPQFRAKNGPPTRSADTGLSGTTLELSSRGGISVDVNVTKEVDHERETGEYHTKTGDMWAV